jgi:hypothetical protein
MANTEDSTEDFSKLVKEEIEKSLPKELNLIRELLSFSIKVLRKCERSELSKTTKYSFHVSLIIFIRAYNSAWASCKLLKIGFPLHAGMICRSLFDDLINLKYLNMGDEEKNAERYLEFRKLRTARSIKRYKGFKGDEGVSDILNEHLEATRAIFKQKFPEGKWDSDWSGITDNEKAKKVGLEKHYYIVSSQLSNYLHGAPEGVDDAMKGTNEGMHQFWIGPRTHLTLEVMSIVTQYLLMSVEVMVNKFSLNNENKELDELLKNWKELFTGKRSQSK